MIDYDSCNRCGEIFPVKEYFLDDSGICKLCRGGPPVKRSAPNEEQHKKRVANLVCRQVMSSLTRNAIDVPHTSELAAAVMKRFGGIEKFADKYFAVVDAILERDPSTRLALSAVDGVAKMIRDSTVMRETAPDVKNLSDEELETEFQRMIEQKLMSGDIVLELQSENAQKASSG